jgi:cytochrome c551/c552
MRFALLFVAIAACGGTSNNAGPGDASTPTDGGVTANAGRLPCDVDAVLNKNNCRECHGSTPQYGAPMSLVTHADMHKALLSDASKKVFEQIPVRVADDAKPMPPPPIARMAQSDRDILQRWVTAGAPEGPETCNNTTPPTDGGSTVGPVPNCTPDIDVIGQTAWEMPQNTTDEYVCVGVSVPVNAKRHAIAVIPKIDNSKIVHHVLLMQADSPVSTTPQPCSSALFQYRILYGWAPGAGGLAFPEEAGLPLEGTTHYVVQLHYSNLNRLSGEKDRSGFQLCTTDKLRPNDADVMAFGSHRFTIPARGKLDITCDLTVPNQVGTRTVFAAMPHMHQLGKYISTTHLPAGGGSPVDLGTSPNFQFETQPWFSVKSTIKSGDVVRTRCAWDNPTGNNVGWGESTSEEMCYSFSLYYPKITSNLWSWAAPAQTSSCKPTP